MQEKCRGDPIKDETSRHCKREEGSVLGRVRVGVQTRATPKLGAGVMLPIKEQ